MSFTKLFSLKKILMLVLSFGLLSFLIIQIKQRKPASAPEKPTLGMSVSELKSSFVPTYYADTSIETFGDDGVHYFSNLYFKNNHFYVSGDSPAESSLHFLGEGHYDYSAIPMNKSQFAKLTASPAHRFSGTTLILATSKEMKNLQPHYFHFLEEFILGWSAHKHFQTLPIKTVIFPDIDNWQGTNNLNLQILKALCPDVTVLGKTSFKELSEKNLLQFEKAIVVDRQGCHNLEPVKTFNKMTVGHAHLIKPEYLKQIRNRLYTMLKTYDQPDRRPTITYIKRKNRRYLDKAFEKELLTTLKSKFPNHRINPVWFEKHTYAEQLQIIRNTDILIGAHGNGLSHSYFLPDNSLVLEIFPEGAYAMDYQLICELSGHEYYAIESDLGIISKIGNHMPPRGNVNQVIPEFDKNWIIEPIEKFIQSKAQSTSNETSLSEEPLIKE